jgi:EAL domain-containing protein (putative c-di-GMP-specific phosphodiesterase class I)/DNA-binding response OmpR family regulator
MHEEAQPEKASAGPVLVVDDDHHSRDLMALSLSLAGLEVVQAASGQQALDLVASGTFAAVVLDNQMPGFSGLEVVRVLRDRRETATMPIILVTADDGPGDRVAGLGTGASDYIVKPFEPDELGARVRAQLRTQALWGEMIDAHRRERRAIAAAVSRLDGETTAENTAWQVCSEIERLGYPGVAIVSVGMPDVVVPIGVAGLPAWQLQAGRRLPAALSTYLVDRASHGPWIDYLDDDEASGFVGGPYPGPAVVAYAPMHAGDELIGLFVLQPGGAPGRASAAAMSRTLAEAIDFADISAGMLGPSLGRRSRHEQRQDEMRRVIDDRAFSPVFQPIVMVDSGEVVGYEALTRFDDGEPPQDRFIDASNLALGVDLELATLKAAVEAQADLPADRWVSLNISPTVVMAGGLLEEVIGGCDRPLVLELTEHDRVDDYPALREALARLTPHVHVSIDDAGAGFASLRHVLELRPEFMKLDRSWIAGIDHDPARQALVAGLTHFSRATGCCLIAEGVESQEELSVLRHFEVELGQGFLFGRPQRLLA